MGRAGAAGPPGATLLGLAWWKPSGIPSGTVASNRCPLSQFRLSFQAKPQWGPAPPATSAPALPTPSQERVGKGETQLVAIASTCCRVRGITSAMKRNVGGGAVGRAAAAVPPGRREGRVTKGRAVPAWPSCVSAGRPLLGNCWPRRLARRGRIGVAAPSLAVGEAIARHGHRRHARPFHPTRKWDCGGDAMRLRL